jgi:hypothetical protein
MSNNSSHLPEFKVVKPVPMSKSTLVTLAQLLLSLVDNGDQFTTVLEEVEAEEIIPPVPRPPEGD